MHLATLRGFCCGAGLTLLVGVWLLGNSHEAATHAADEPSTKGWQPGQGWGWNWAPDDEVGALNAMTPDSVRAALQLARTGRVFDLGVTYSRNSYKWPGHNAAEVMTYRGPEGVKRQADHPFALPEANPSGQAWHSCALFISDNVGTQIDGLGHVTVGDDNHWYNGYRESDWGGNFGVRKCDATTIPPIIARGVLLDLAGLKQVDALPHGYAISPGDIDAACRRQQVELRPGDVVLIRTGVLRYWGRDGADADVLSEHDSAGITLETARYLVEQHGAMMIGADTSGLEVNPPAAPTDTFIPVHRYLLIEQGVHIGEFHFLEDLAREQAWEFCYIASTNKIAGTTAGFALRPLAIR
ncbi:MAG: cyclase family protein [Pirellulales bacterium]|nr:cyclase family protein [Pirellulales bacterium]